MTRAKDISKILTDADISGTLDVTGETTLATHLNLGDNDKIKLGASGDLEIYHDGSNSYISDEGTGHLYLRGTNLRLANTSGSENYLVATDGGGVTINHTGNVKLTTTSSGATVTGDLEVTDDIDLNSDSAKITFGGSSETIILEHVADTGLNLQGSGTNTNFSLLSFHTANSTVADLRLGKSSNNTVGTFEVTASGEALGQIRFTGQDSNNGTREGAMISVDQSASSTATTVPSDMKFFTTGSERMRIDSSGRVGIGAVPIAHFHSSILQVGAQSALGANPTLSTTSQTYLTHNLYFNTDGNLRVFNTSSANEGAILQMADGSFRFSNSSATTGTPTVNERMRITSDGALNVQGVYSQSTSGGANINVASDGHIRRSTSSLKYKNTINDATHGLTELLTLRPVTYKGNNDGDTIFGGLIAEEVHDAGLTEFVQYDDDNKPDALAYGNMVSLCIKAIQELKAENTALANRITTLEGA